MNRVDLILKHTDGPVVLDLGAVQHDAEKADEETWVHKHLTQEYERVIGVDILADEVQELRRQGYDIRQADVTTMDLGVRADTVVAGELIEHIANPGLMLERIAEHMKPGGRLVLTTPNQWALVHLRRLLTTGLEVNTEHVAWYDHRMLEQLLNRYGYEVTALETTTRDHKGITGLAQALGSDVFGGTSWVCVAERGD